MKRFTTIILLVQAVACLTLTKLMMLRNNKTNKQGQNQGQSSGGGSKSKQDKQQYSAEYKAGWNKAMEDYKNGKLKL